MQADRRWSKPLREMSNQSISFRVFTVLLATMILGAQSKWLSLKAHNVQVHGSHARDA